MTRSRAISHLTLRYAEITLLTWLAYEVSMACTALSVTFAALWTVAVFEIVVLTNLARSIHSLFALSANLRSLPAFQ